MTTTQQLISQHFAYLQPQCNVSLAPMTYFKIGGPAEVFIETKTNEDVVKVLQFCMTQHIPFHILGGASNIIISSEGLRGVVIKSSDRFYEVTGEKALHGKDIIRAGSGFKTALFVRETIDDGYTGLEYFLGVPGTIGGAIYNNAHYMTDLIGQHVHAVEVLNQKGEVVWVPASECEFGYDSSRFQKNQEVILRTDFALKKGDKEHSLSLVKAATEYRAKTQPLGEPSSGCYFQNTLNTPELQKLLPQFAERREVPSAYLIEHAGLKGTQVGGVKVSKKHAAFLINTGSGTSEDVKQLAKIIKQRVHEQYGVELKEEVFFLE